MPYYPVSLKASLTFSVTFGFRDAGRSSAACISCTLPWRFHRLRRIWTTHSTQSLQRLHWTENMHAYWYINFGDFIEMPHVITWGKTCPFFCEKCMQQDSPLSDRNEAYFAKWSTSNTTSMVVFCHNERRLKITRFKLQILYIHV